MQEYKSILVQRFPTCVPRHTSVPRDGARCTARFWIFFSSKFRNKNSTSPGKKSERKLRICL